VAFGRLTNRHDSWLGFCGRHRHLLAVAQLPCGVVRHEGRFRDLLEYGAASAGDAAVTLCGLSAERWAGLTGLVAAFFRDVETFAPLDRFPAFRREVERRRGTPDAGS
jgi:hypothetical protein